jgi:peptide-methionine (R)-S-oxide reductase
MAEQQNPNLTEEQKEILFNKGTEAPFSGEYVHTDTAGNYVCANCDAVLFTSAAKFSSDCGWPSFYDVANKKAVHLVEDLSHGMHRVEVTCATCGAHMGHVFNDAPDQPTGLRFCINSLSLDFQEKK